MSPSNWLGSWTAAGVVRAARTGPILDGIDKNHRYLCRILASQNITCHIKKIARRQFETTYRSTAVFPTTCEYVALCQVDSVAPGTQSQAIVPTDRRITFHRYSLYDSRSSNPGIHGRECGFEFVVAAGLSGSNRAISSQVSCLILTMTIPYY